VSDSVPVSVVIPTVGRPRLLAQCLESLARCRPRAAEVLVVDQSGEREVAELVERFSGIGARLVSLPRPNLSWARNAGMQQAGEEVVLFIDDDCTVAEDWAGAAWRLMSRDPDRIVTGRVIGTSPDVPSVREDEERHDHTGEHRCDVLRPNNMGARRTQLLEFGGFDERFKGAGEDLDLCYRWLRAGRRLWFRAGARGLAPRLAFAARAVAPLPALLARAGGLLRQAPAPRRFRGPAVRQARLEAGVSGRGRGNPAARAARHARGPPAPPRFRNRHWPETATVVRKESLNVAALP
jgi:glycosyltransferase involved in cell wall biosynthesis